MIDRLNDPGRFEADQHVHETRDALSKDIPRNRELQDETLRHPTGDEAARRRTASPRPMTHSPQHGR